RNVQPGESSFSGSTAYHQRSDAAMAGCFAFGEENIHSVNIERPEQPSAYASSARRIPTSKTVAVLQLTFTQCKTDAGDLTPFCRVIVEEALATLKLRSN
ncbi:hypothetical protein ACO22_07569, partial [Paracoccidioides brasiliensis]